MEYSLEFARFQIFSSKQKELFLKKLEDFLLCKTEKNIIHGGKKRGCFRK